MPRFLQRENIASFRRTRLATKFRHVYRKKLPGLTGLYLTFVVCFFFQPSFLVFELLSYAIITWTNCWVLCHNVTLLCSCYPFQFKLNGTLETTIHEVHLWYPCATCLTGLRLSISVNTRQENQRNMSLFPVFWNTSNDTYKEAYLKVRKTWKYSVINVLTTEHN